MALGRARYPITSAYERRLPEGLDSYPDCAVRADLFRGLGAEVPALLDDPTLPEVMRDVLTERHTEDWIAETVGLSLLMMVRDVAYDDDQAYFDWSRAWIARTFRKPLYRALMLILSPTLVVMGAARRWSTFHQGSTLTVSKVQPRDDRLVLEGHLAFPPHLFQPFILEQVCYSLLAALDASRATEPQINLRECNTAEGGFDISWLQ